MKLLVAGTVPPIWRPGADHTPGVKGLPSTLLVARETRRSACGSLELSFFCSLAFCLLDAKKPMNR
jgi:hypothetical protein